MSDLTKEIEKLKSEKGIIDNELVVQQVTFANKIKNGYGSKIKEELSKQNDYNKKENKTLFKRIKSWFCRK